MLGDQIDYAQAISNAAIQNNVDPSLALEVAIAESNLNPTAVSPAGAIGIMQLMPATAAQYGADPTDPLENIDAGTAYLGDLLNQFGGNAVAALAAYNWGPGNVQNAIKKYGGNWLSHAPAETQNYVAKILGNVSTQYQASGPIPAPTASTPLPVPAAPVAAITLPPLVSPQGGIGVGGWIVLAIIGGVVLILYATD
jgi:hypothetical protein